MKHARRLAERMLEIAVVKGDYAYYPNVGLGNDFSYPGKSGWTHTKEPTSGKEGAEQAPLKPVPAYVHPEKLVQLTAG